MNFNFRNYNPENYGVKFLQEGGPMTEEAPVENEATVPAEDPATLILEAASQALQSQDCNLAMEVCQALLQMAGGGGEPAPQQAPEGQAPVYKRGGRLSRWIKK